MNYLKLIHLLKPYNMSYVKNRNNKTTLINLEKKAHYLCWKYAMTSPLNHQKDKQILTKLFNGKNKDLRINRPFHCDYGINICCNGVAFFNVDDTILDSSPVILGNNVIIAPHVCVSCVGHPIYPTQRKQGISVSKPIIIGDNVWVGADSFINGGVKIGENSIIGAGSIVTNSIPSNVVAFGTPCKVHRKITKRDLIDKDDIC